MTNAMDFVAEHDRGVLVTIKSDGRPQLSNINYAVVDATIQISITADRAKTANLRRDPRASLHVTAAEFYPYVVIEGDAELGPIASEPGDEAVVHLRELYRAVQGEHPDWNEYDEAMIRDKRLVLTIHPTHTYGIAG